MENSIVALNPHLGGLQPAQLSELFKSITERHQRVSKIETPANEVKKDFGGNDYVEVSYMRRVANMEFPGWSFTILNQMTHRVGEFEVAFTVHGRLTWIEDGVIRQGDMVASHNNLFVYAKAKRGKTAQQMGYPSGYSVDDDNYILKPTGEKVPTGYLSVSNAWKSAVTECQKKAFNSYMNIADDVYRNVDVSLDEKERSELIKILQPIDSSWLEEEYGFTVEEMNDKILSGTINKSNINASRAKMQRWRDDWDSKNKQSE